MLSWMLKERRPSAAEQNSKQIKRGLQVGESSASLLSLMPTPGTLTFAANLQGCALSASG